jgi:hypothetical protein
VDDYLKEADGEHFIDLCPTWDLLSLLLDENAEWSYRGGIERGSDNYIRIEDLEPRKNIQRAGRFSSERRLPTPRLLNEPLPTAPSANKVI